MSTEFGIKLLSFAYASKLEDSTSQCKFGDRFATWNIDTGKANPSHVDHWDMKALASPMGRKATVQMKIAGPGVQFMPFQLDISSWLVVPLLSEYFLLYKILLPGEFPWKLKSHGNVQAFFNDLVT